ncbi:MAG: polyphenol oxidase family protein [Burkholderiaceae bacterium]
MPKSITPIEGWPTGVRAAFTTRGLGCELVQPAVAGRVDQTHETNSTNGTDAAGMRTDFDGLNLGAHVGDEPSRVLFHRQAVEQFIGAKPIWLNQIHGAEVLRVDGHQRPTAQAPLTSLSTSLSSDLPAVDGLITNQAGQAACIMAADCLPVLAATTDGQWVGAAHAGWRGLAAGVLENLLKAMTEAQNQAQEQDQQRAAAQDPSVMVWLGPCIGPQAFEVGPEVLQAFELQATDPLVQPSQRPQHFYLDLAGLAARRLQQWALDHRVTLDLRNQDQACTWSDPERYYSHRRSAPCGRMAFLIWREA